MPRRPAEPDPVEIVLVPIDPTTAGADADRVPPTAGAGTLQPLAPVVAATVATAVTRLLRGDDPPLVRGPAFGGSWSDQRLHRPVRLSPWDAEAALHDVVRATGGRIDEPPRAGRWVPHRLGRLVLAPFPPVASREPVPGYGGSLQLPVPGRATRIELTLEPWSAHRSDLCLHARHRRIGPHLPRRYYDVAHRVMDELWLLIERAAAA